MSQPLISKAIHKNKPHENIEKKKSKGKTERKCRKIHFFSSFNID